MIARDPSLQAAVLAALEHHAVRHCVLRDPGAGDREVDLLVDRRDLDRFTAVVEPFGFLRRRVAGRGGHHFFLAFDDRDGDWLKLDVVTRLRFGGPSRAHAPRVLASCLDRRVRTAAGWRPDPVDAVLALVLHGVLDKRAFSPWRQDEVRRLRDTIEASTALRAAAAKRFQDALGTTCTWAETAHIVATGDVSAILDRRRAIAGELLRRDPWGYAARRAEGAVLSIVRRLAAPFVHAGFAVALMGPDGAGKTTLAGVLRTDRQLRARIVYMGANPDRSMRWLPTSRWSRRRASDGALARTGVYAHRLLEQTLRSMVAWSARLRGRFVVFDRHPHELRAAPAGRGAGSRLRRWLLLSASLRPDLVLVLDAPTPMLSERKPEHDLDRSERQRARYRGLNHTLGDTVMLDASRPVAETARDAKRIVWEHYRRRMTARSGGHASGNGMRAASPPRNAPAIDEEVRLHGPGA